MQYDSKDIKAARERGSTVDTIRDTRRADERTQKSEAYYRNKFERVGAKSGNIDFKVSRTSSSQSRALQGVEIIFANQPSIFISSESILENYAGEDYWSIVFNVSGSSFSGTYTFDSTEDLTDEDGNGDQTARRLRVITLNGGNQPVSISAYGQYRESLICSSGSPLVVLTKQS